MLAGDPYDSLVEDSGNMGRTARRLQQTPPRPRESLASWEDRVADEDAFAANQETERKKLRAADLEQRDIAHYLDPGGEPIIIRDTSGEPLYDYGDKSGAVFDKSGKPFGLHFDETGPPKVVDAFDGLTKAGPLRKGTPWQRQIDRSDDDLAAEAHKTVAKYAQEARRQLDDYEAALAADESSLPMEEAELADLDAVKLPKLKRESEPGLLAGMFGAEASDEKYTLKAKEFEAATQRRNELAKTIETRRARMTQARQSVAAASAEAQAAQAMEMQTREQQMAAMRRKLTEHGFTVPTWPDETRRQELLAQHDVETAGQMLAAEQQFAAESSAGASGWALPEAQRPAVQYPPSALRGGDLDRRAFMQRVAGEAEATGQPAAVIAAKAAAEATQQGAQTIGGTPAAEIASKAAPAKVEQAFGVNAERLARMEASQPKKEFFDTQDFFASIWDALSGLGTQATAAYYQLVEGMDRPDQYSASAKAAFADADALNRSMQAKTAALQSLGKSSSVGESIREAGGSLGFSLGSMAAAIPAGIVGAKAGGAIGAAAGAPAAGAGAAPGAVVGGLIGGGLAAGAASFGAAYRMAGAMFLSEAFKELEAKYQEQHGRAMSEEEKQSAYEALLPVAKNTALWEAGPEAVGNAVTLGAGKVILGIGKPVFKELMKKAAGRAAVKLGAGGAAVGTELATETITQVEQDADQRKMRAFSEGRSMEEETADWSAAGVKKAFVEVAPQTLALLGLMGGGAVAVKKTIDGGRVLVDQAQYRNALRQSTGDTESYAALSEQYDDLTLVSDGALDVSDYNEKYGAALRNPAQALDARRRLNRGLTAAVRNVMGSTPEFVDTVLAQTPLDDTQRAQARELAGQYGPSAPALVALGRFAREAGVADVPTPVAAGHEALTGFRGEAATDHAIGASLAAGALSDLALGKPIAPEAEGLLVELGLAVPAPAEIEGVAPTGPAVKLHSDAVKYLPPTLREAIATQAATNPETLNATFPGVFLATDAAGQVSTRFDRDGRAILADEARAHDAHIKAWWAAQDTEDAAADAEGEQPAPPTGKEGSDPTPAGKRSQGSQSKEGAEQEGASGEPTTPPTTDLVSKDENFQPAPAAENNHSAATKGAPGQAGSSSTTEQTNENEEPTDQETPAIQPEGKGGAENTTEKGQGPSAGGGVVPQQRGDAVAFARQAVETARRKNLELLNRLGAEEFFDATGQIGGTGIATNPHTGEILFDAEALAKAMRAVEEKGLNVQEWLNKAVEEEAIHVAQILIHGKGGAFLNHYTQLEGKLPDGAAEAMVKAYGKKPAMLAAEYERALWQYRATGEFITEEVAGFDVAALRKILAGEQPPEVEASLAKLMRMTEGEAPAAAMKDAFDGLADARLVSQIEDLERQLAEEGKTDEVEIKRGDWIEYTDSYGKTHRGKVASVWKVGRIIPGSGATKPRVEYSVEDADGTPMPSPKEGSAIRKIDAPAKPETKPPAKASRKEKPAATKPETKPSPKPKKPAAGADLLPDGLFAANPADTFKQALPREKAAQFMQVAFALLDVGVDTPDKLAAALEEKYAGRARPFSNALWKTMENVGAPEATPDWPAIYSALENTGDAGDTAADERDGDTDQSDTPTDADAGGDGDLQGDDRDADEGGESRPPRVSGGRGNTGGGTEQSGAEPLSDGTELDSERGGSTGGEGDRTGGVGELPAGDVLDDAGGNVRLTLADNIGAGGLVTKFRENVAAIKLLKQIEADEAEGPREVTTAEQKILARYVGWGALAQKAFDPAGEFYAETKELLTPEEWQAARDSTINAHFTAPEAIQGIYRWLRKMGFQGNARITEPSSGVGHFFGYMPADFMRGSKLTAIEKDNLTARIAKRLYQDAAVWNRPFERHVMADNSQDLMISNVPFSETDHPNDPRYNQINPNLHDYFFLKMLDKTRPGGFVVAITSMGTLDKLSADVREQLSARANLVGAFRLPNTMFKGNAGTEVTTDIIILQKRGPGVKTTSEEWLTAVDFKTRTGDTIKINQYFRDHPERMLGTMTSEGKMYFRPKEGEQRAGEKALLSDGRSVEQLFADAEKMLPADIYVTPDAQRRAVEEAESIEFDPNTVPDGSFVLDGQGNVKTWKGGELHPALKDVNPDTKRDKILRDLIERGVLALGDDEVVRPTGRYWAVTDDKAEREIREWVERELVRGLYYQEIVEEEYEDDSGPVKVMRTREVPKMSYAFSVPFGKTEIERIKQLIPLRNAMKELLRGQMQERPESELAGQRQTLNLLYDVYVKANGYLHEARTSNAFNDDPFFPRLLALENVNDLTGETTKADIFTKNTAPKRETLTRLEGSAREGMVQVLAARGKVDIEYQAQLSSREPEEIVAELEKDGLIFLDPTRGEYVPTEEYLSGNIYEKLAAARLAYETDPTFRRNVEELEKAIPPLHPVERIGFAFGAPFIPHETYKKFARHLLKDEEAVVTLTEAGGRFGFSMGKRNVEGFATDDYDTEELIADALNLKSPLVKRFPKEGSPYVDEEATDAARNALERLRVEFRNWILDTEEVASLLHKNFNERFNAYRSRTYTAPFLTLPGMSADIKLRQHQLDAVWRAIVDGKVVLAHAVGAGKTFEMFGAVMEWKRLGLAKKPMLVFPNHLLRSGQMAADFYRMYPNAKLLVVTQKDFTAKRRQRLMARIATGEWDAVLIGHSQIGLIPVTPELQAAQIREELAELEEVVRDAEANNDGSKSKQKRVKQLVKMLEKKRSDLEKLLDPSKQDKALYFEELGVDALIVDESHEFKNLNFSTKLTNISGLGNANSETKKTAQLKMKTDYILRRNNNRGVIFASGTPIANSIAEIYLLQKYIAQDVLDEQGIRSFDEWAATFATIAKVGEISPDGQTLQEKEKFLAFKNLQQLMLGIRRYVDVKLAKHLNLPTPPLLTGKQIAVTLKPTPTVEAMSAEIVARAEVLRGGRYDPRVDNWLKLYSDGRKISTHPKLYDHTAEESPEDKVPVAMGMVADLYKANDYRRGTQIIFCDLYQNKEERPVIDAFGQPVLHTRGKKRGEPKVETIIHFNLFDRMKELLIAKGVKPEHIATVHDFPKDDDKAELFRKMNKGEYRILLATTPKLGTGANVQRRLVGVWAIDAPDRPDQQEQREGRGIRQGNMFHEAGSGKPPKQGRLLPWQPIVELEDGIIVTREGRRRAAFEIVVPRVAVERTLESRRFQTLADKNTAIQTIMAGEFEGDEFVNEETDSGGYYEIMAAASGNPLIMEEFKLSAEVRRLENARSDHERRQNRARRDLAYYAAQIEELAKTKEIVPLLREVSRERQKDIEGRHAEMKDARAAELEKKATYNPEKPFVVTVTKMKAGTKTVVESETQVEKTLAEILAEKFEPTKNEPDGVLVDVHAFGLRARIVKKGMEYTVGTGAEAKQTKRYSYLLNFSGSSTNTYQIGLQDNDDPVTPWEGGFENAKRQRDYLIRREAGIQLEKEGLPTDVEIAGQNYDNEQRAVAALKQALDDAGTNERLTIKVLGVEAEITKRLAEAINGEKRLMAFTVFKELANASEYRPRQMGAEDAAGILSAIRAELNMMPAKEYLEERLTTAKKEREVAESRIGQSFPEQDLLTSKSARLAAVRRALNPDAQEEGEADAGPLIGAANPADAKRVRALRLIASKRALRSEEAAELARLTRRKTKARQFKNATVTGPENILIEAAKPGVDEGLASGESGSRANLSKVAGENEKARHADRSRDASDTGAVDEAIAGGGTARGTDGEGRTGGREGSGSTSVSGRREQAVERGIAAARARQPGLQYREATADEMKLNPALLAAEKDGEIVHSSVNLVARMTKIAEHPEGSVEMAEAWLEAVLGGASAIGEEPWHVAERRVAAARKRYPAHIRAEIWNAAPESVRAAMIAMYGPAPEGARPDYYHGAELVRAVCQILNGEGVTEQFLPWKKTEVAAFGAAVRAWSIPIQAQAHFMAMRLEAAGKMQGAKYGSGSGEMQHAGYRADFSKSNNAANAEAEGRFPASEIARRLGVPLGFIREHAPHSGEWHHSSKFYNRVPYYDLAEVEDWMAGKGNYEVSGDEPTGGDLLAEYRIKQKALKENAPDVLIGQTIKYLEWGGTRNHPRATERKLENVTIERKPGQKMVTITPADGKTFKKALDTRGFEIRDTDGKFFPAEFVFKRAIDRAKNSLPWPGLPPGFTVRRIPDPAGDEHTTYIVNDASWKAPYSITEIGASSPVEAVEKWAAKEREKGAGTGLLLGAANPNYIPGADEDALDDADGMDIEAIVAAKISSFGVPIEDKATADWKGKRVSAPQAIRAVAKIVETMTEHELPIRLRRFRHRALGIFKVYPEVVRLRDANDVATATHEVGHALQKAVYGEVKVRAFGKLPKMVKAELIKLGRALYGAQKPSAGYTSEGFAELVRIALTTDDAALQAPAAYDFFFNQIFPGNAKLDGAIKAAKEVVDQYRKQGLANKQKASIVDPTTLGHKLKQLGTKLTPQELFRNWVDEFEPLRSLSAQVGKALGRVLNLDEDPYAIASFRRGSAAGVAAHWVGHAMTDFRGNITGPGLAQALAIVRGREEDFVRYLWAVRALERWGVDPFTGKPTGGKPKNPGMSQAEAQATFDEFKDDAKFNLAANQVWDWGHGVLRYVAESSPTLAPVIEKIMRGSKYYLPLSRYIDPLEVKTGVLGPANPLRKMLGSGRQILPPIEQMVANAVQMAQLAHKRQVLDAVVRMRNVEGLGYRIEQVPRDQVRNTLTLDKIREQLEDLGIDTTAAEDAEILTYYSPMAFPKGKDPIISHTVQAGVDPKTGKPVMETKWYFVDPRLYDVLEGIEPYKLPKIVDLIFGVPARIFRLGTTGLRAAFSLFTNPARDLPTLLLQTKTKGVGGRLLLGWINGIRQLLNPKRLAGQNSEWINLFERLGAEVGQPLGPDLASAKRAIGALHHGMVRRVVTNPLDALRELFSVTEAAPRLAEMQAVADEIGWTPGSPMTMRQSIALGLAFKQVTVDFSAAGRIGKVVNQTVPFFNATIQGARIFARTLQRAKGDPQALATLTFKLLALMTLPALWLWWRNKDEDWYRDMPWRDRYLYFNIPTGDGKLLQIPRPFEWGNVFATIPEALFDAVHREDPQMAAEAFKHIIKTSNPIDLPVPLRVAREQLENRVTFFDRPIVPRGEEDLPPGEQRGPYTSRLATMLGDIFPDAVSPRRVDHFIRAATGGAFGDATRDLDTIAQVLGFKEGRRELEASDIPIAGRAFRRGGEEGTTSLAVEKFFDAYTDAQARAKSRQIVETPQDRARRLTLEDARKAITVLSTIRNATASLEKRQALQRQIRTVAEQALAIAPKASPLTRLPYDKLPPRGAPRAPSKPVPRANPWKGITGNESWRTLTSF